MTTFFWIIEYIASFIEIFMCCVFCGAFLVKEEFGDRKYLAFAGAALSALLITGLNKIEIFSVFNSIFVLFVIILFQLFLYKAKIGLCIVLPLIYAVILAAIDFAVSYFTALILQVDANYLLNHQNFSRVLCILMSKFLLILTVVTIRKLLRKSIIFIKKYIVIMCIYSAFLLVSLHIMVELNIKNRSPETELFLVIFFITSISIELLVLYFIIKTGESYEQQQKNELIDMKNTMLQKSLDETEQAFQLWRRSVHDYKNHVIALRQLAADENMEGIKEYLNCENELIQKKMFYIKTGNSVVDAIVNTKQRLSEEKGITFIVNAAIPKKCCVREIDMSNILGNLIDNAMEACAGLSDPNRWVSIQILYSENMLSILIINPSNIVQINDGHIPTTKQDPLLHGFGIGNVKDILEKYHAEYLFTYDDGRFIFSADWPDIAEPSANTSILS